MDRQQRQSTGRVSRRQFAALAAGGVAGGALAARLLGSAAAAGEQPAKWPMRLSTSSVHFRKLPLAEACRRIAALGFEAIDIWHARFESPHLEEIETHLKAEGLRDLLAQHKLQLAAITAYMIPLSRATDVLGPLGGGLIVRGSSALPPGTSTAAAMQRFFEQLKPDVELAEKHNCHLAIENHSNSLLNSLDSFKAFAEANRHPRVGIALAPYHLQKEQVDMGQVFAAAGRQLRFFYAWQFGKTLDQLPGIGATDFTPWLALLAQAGYQGYVNPFTHFHVEADAMQPALAQSRDYLRTCYQRLP